MKIAVVALGKIGLPLAVQFASKGHEVVGVDVNATVVDLVNAGTEPFPGEAHLQEKLSSTVADGRLRATTDYGDAVPGADAVVLVVPLFVDDEARPDFGWMDGATTELAKHLTPGTLVSYETTLPVGTTRTRWKPMLEEGSGLTEGEDFHLVFSPERVLTGRVFEDLRRYPKLIGGLTPAGAERAREFYEAVLDFDERPDLPRAYRSPWFPLPQIISSVGIIIAIVNITPPGMDSRQVLVPFGIMLGLTAAYALFWTVCVQRVNPFKPLVVEEVVDRAISNYEKQTRGEMTPDVLRPLV